MGLRQLTLSALLAALVLAGCSDDTPAFCTPLAEIADVGSLSAAIEAGQLDVAANEARRIVDVAEEAPPEIRSDVRALGTAVGDLVELLAAEQRGSETLAGDTTRLRAEINAQLSRMDERSDRVSRWALRECGLEL